MVILVIGPSNAGKSFLCENVYWKLNDTYHFNMDKKAQVRVEGYMDRAEKLALDCQEKEEFYLLDFGAGFQNIEENNISFNFFKRFSDQTIVVLDNPEKIYSRHKNRDYSNFYHTEFRKYRQDIYNLARYQLYRSSNAEDDIKKFKKYCFLIQKQ